MDLRIGFDAQAIFGAGRAETPRRPSAKLFPLAGRHAVAG